MSKSRMEEMADEIQNLKNSGETIEAAIVRAEDHLSLLRAIRTATKQTDARPRKARQTADGCLVDSTELGQLDGGD